MLPPLNYKSQNQMKFISHSHSRPRIARQFRVGTGQTRSDESETENQLCHRREHRFSLKVQDLDLDPKAVTAGITDALGGKPALTQEEVHSALLKLEQDIQAKNAAEAAKYADGAKNLKDGEAFLAANKTKDGVKVHSVTLPDGTTAELQYKILKSGTGDTPKKTDTVTVNYTGTLIDGTVFDSSVQRGQPATFPLTRRDPRLDRGAADDEGG